MKNHVHLFSLVRKIGIGVFALVLPQVALAENVPATVTFIKGSVVVVDAEGKTVPIAVGSKIPAGDTVKTGADGQLGLTLTPGAGTVVRPSSEVKISTLDFSKGTDGGNNRTIQLNLKNGSLLSTLFKKDGHSDFKVSTPYGVAAAKGTSWAVIVDGISLNVEVLNGTVSVTGPGINVSVPAGQGFDSKNGQLTDLPQSVIDALTSELQQALPNLTNLTPTQLQQAFESANPSTVVNKDQINSNNQ